MLIPPYKGELVDLMTSHDEIRELSAFAASLPSVRLSQREVCDLEMIATGAFSPLRSFMSEADHRSVLAGMRLADGTLFPLPVTVGASEEDHLRLGRDLALRSPTNELLALMTVDDVYEWDRSEYAEAVLGTSDPRHPLVAELTGWGRFNFS